MIEPIDFSEHLVPDLDAQGPGSFAMAWSRIGSLPERFAATAGDRLPEGVSVSIEDFDDGGNLTMLLDGDPELRVHMPVPPEADRETMESLGRYMAASLHSAMTRGAIVLADPRRRRASDEIMLRARRGAAVAIVLARARRWIQTTLPSAFGPAEMSKGASWKNVEAEHMAMLQTLPPCLSLCIDHDPGINFSMSIGPAYGPSVDPVSVDRIDVMRAIADGRI